MVALSSPQDMAKKRASNGRQDHPVGDLISVDDAWRDRLRRGLTAKDWDQGDLADKIPCSEATITNLLKSTKDGGTRQTRLAGRIHELLGWEPPEKGSASPIAMDDEQWRRLKKRWPALSAEFRAHILGLIDSVVPKR